MIATNCSVRDVAEQIRPLLVISSDSAPYCIGAIAGVLSLQGGISHESRSYLFSRKACGEAPFNFITSTGFSDCNKIDFVSMLMYE